MKILKNYKILFFIFVSAFAFSQNETDKSEQISFLNELYQQTINSNLEVNPTQIPIVNNQTNSIYIKQIGLNNKTHLKSKSLNSNIDLVQNGNNNWVWLNISSLAISETIQQQGNNHYLSLYGNSSLLNIQQTINQEGYGQNLVIHGNNSLSEKMELTMKGYSKTIIIRNFN